MGEEITLRSASYRTGSCTLPNQNKMISINKILTSLEANISAEEVLLGGTEEHAEQTDEREEREAQRRDAFFAPSEGF